MLSALFRRAAGGRRFAGPVDARLYAVGDVHGRLDLVDDLLDRIERDLRDWPVASAMLVFLGDLIDRGPDSAGVIGRLCGMAALPASPSFLMGNHEEMLLRALAGEPGAANDWLRFGGDACAESYGLSPAMLGAATGERAAALLTDALPAAHVAFLQVMGDRVRFGDYLCVHAGIRPGIAIGEQAPQDLRWIRHPFLTDRRDHGVMVIHGHTISDGVERRANRIGIDTGAYRTGVLTAAVVEGHELRFLATGN